MLLTISSTKAKSPPSCTSDKMFADRFSGFFVGKTETIRNGFTLESVSLSSISNDASQESECAPHLVEFEPTTDDEVLKILMGSPTKSCELDPLQPTWVL